MITLAQPRNGWLAQLDKGSGVMSGIDHITDRVLPASDRIDPAVRQKLPRSSMSIADIVLALHDLRVKRVYTTFEFRTCEEYVHRVQILVENTGERDCWVVPSVFYDKKILVAFCAKDYRGGEAILTPSGRNDEILCKLLFHHCWDRATLAQRKLLFRAFVEPDSDPPPNATPEKVLKEDFEGGCHQKLEASMWSDTLPMADILRTPLIGFLPESVRQAFTDQRDSTLANLCCDTDYVEFFEKLHMKFFQLIWLSKPIPAKQYCTITVEDQRFLTSKYKGTPGGTRPGIRRRIFGFGSSECTLPIEVEGTTPLHSEAAFHTRVTPPEGVKLDLQPGWIIRKLRLSRPIYANEETIVDRNKIDFYHLRAAGRERCDSLYASLKLDSKRVRLSSDVSACVKRTEVPDMRTRFEDNVMMLYFRRQNKGRKLCNDRADHGLCFRLSLKSDFARLSHWVIIILLALTVFMTLLLLPQKYAVAVAARNTIDPPALALIDEYFWPIITMMIAQSAATLFDYSRRSESQQHFLVRTMQLIVSLALIEFTLVLIGPVVLGLAPFVWKSGAFMAVRFILVG